MFTPLFFFVFLAVDDCTITYEAWPDQQVTDYADCVTNTQPGQCVVASAGDPFTAPPGPAIPLDASTSSVPHGAGALTFQWTQVDNGAPTVALTGADTATPTFAASDQGTYVFEVTVGWYCRTDTDTVEVTVGNRMIPASLNVESVAFISAQPMQLTFSSPGDDRLFIVTKDGFVWILKNGTIQSTPFLDISGRVSGSSEQGLLGIAFHPDYASNGLFYLNYTGTFPGAGGSSNDTRIVGYGTDAGNPDLADPSTATLLLSITQPFNNHNGGQIHFGPDGMLYIGMGDGGAGGDPDNHAQNPLSQLGKMLRYETNGLDPLSIPANNPFVGDPDTLDEIWALGLRNPWRFSFDRGTGDMYIGDVGQADWEEVSYEHNTSMGGENFGWRLKEGTHCFNPSTNCDPDGITTDPIHEYFSNGGFCSVIGGYVYRGSDVPNLDGFYIFADFCGSGNNSLPGAHSLIRLGEDWVANDLELFLDDNILSTSIAAFGEDSQGELYICSFGGSLLKVTGIREFFP